MTSEQKSNLKKSSHLIYPDTWQPYPYQIQHSNSAFCPVRVRLNIYDVFCEKVVAFVHKPKISKLGPKVLALLLSYIS